MDPIPGSYRGTHKRKIKAYHIISRIFLPLGIVLLALGVILLACCIPGTIAGLRELEASGSCAQTATGYHCEANAEAGLFVFTIIGLAFGITDFTLGLPMLIIASVFRSVARACRMEDEANGVDFTGFPYGK